MSTKACFIRAMSSFFNSTSGAATTPALCYSYRLAAVGQFESSVPDTHWTMKYFSALSVACALDAAQSFGLTGKLNPVGSSGNGVSGSRHLR